MIYPSGVFVNDDYVNFWKKFSLFFFIFSHGCPVLPFFPVFTYTLTLKNIAILLIFSIFQKKRKKIWIF